MLLDIFLLLFLGFVSSQLAQLLRFPMPFLLGPLFLIGSLRVYGIELPYTPAFFAPFIQILLGISVGSRFNRETISRLKEVVVPGIIVVVWALTVVFFLGWILAQITFLDPFTAILSSSIGGFPEMVIIALAVDADLGVILLIQLSRMVTTFLIFPFFIKNQVSSQKTGGGQGGEVSAPQQPNLTPGIFQILVTFLLGSLGGILFLSLGVPAGGMVGSMLVVSAAGCLGLPIFSYPKFFFNFIIIGVGLMAADNFSSSTLLILTSGEILLPLFCSLFFTFSTSFLVASLLTKLTGWDKATSFLAAAPAGFTAMVILAKEYNLDILPISFLQLCRLMALKTVVPFVFMFLIHS